MGLWLDTTGRSTLGIGICDRCKRKFSLDDLMKDPNAPGLRVCIDDLDQLDPYRLPARKTETITLPFLRPDEPLGTDPRGFIDEHYEEFVITEDSDEYLEL
jgi:hypothetical protein